MLSTWRTEKVSVITNLIQPTVQIINVGGERHEVTFQTLAKLPQTRLAKLRGATSQAELNMLCDR